MAFRKSMGEVRVAQLPIRLKLTPYSQIAALIALGGIVAGTFYVQDLRYSVPSFLAFLGAITLVYRTLKRRKVKGTGGSQ